MSEKKKILLQSNTIFSNTTTSSYKVPSIFHPHCTHHYTNTFSVVTKFQDMPFLFSLNSRTEFSFLAVQYFHVWPNSICIFGKTEFSFFCRRKCPCFTEQYCCWYEIVGGKVLHVCAQLPLTRQRQPRWDRMGAQLATLIHCRHL